MVLAICFSDYFYTTVLSSNHLSSQQNRIDLNHLTLELLCRLCVTSFTILSSYSFIGHYMFRPKWPFQVYRLLWLRLHKDNLGLRTPGVYRTPCECRHWADRPFGGREVEGASAAHPEKSAVAENSVDLGYRIQFHNTSVLTTETQCMDHIVREPVEIELHRNNMNREVGFCQVMEASHLLPQET
jgi:hypothetical protein